MIYHSLTSDNKSQYEEYLKIIGSLSALFSDSDVPYLYYRIAEKIYCMAFGAKDHSRGDIAIDASLSNHGIGLKTFLRNNNKTFQKVAEFNKQKETYDNLPAEKSIFEIANLRNARIDFSKHNIDIENLIYHCVVRDSGKFYIFEEEMKSIDINSLKFDKENGNSLLFHDKFYEYSFNKSKSTLLKRFNTSNFITEINIGIIQNPLEYLKELLLKIDTVIPQSKDFIYLPLYGKNRIVFDKSGLNQWNAEGRARNYDEIYIPIPSDIHKFKTNFFPPRDIKFNLLLPNKKSLTCKLCQDGAKALMSDPNKALGKWLLRDVLRLNHGEILTIDMLEKLGIDSVRIDKIDDGNYEINFSKLYSYDDFIMDFQ